MSDYRVVLDAYSGPLDLLLFLIRREEVDIYDISIARLTDQYVQYVELLQQIDPETIGEFLVLAATLMEIKSRTLLPKPPPEEMDEDLGDPRLELVRQLLEYKKYKDAARSLEESAVERALRHARHPVLPPDDPSEVELDSLEIWDLFDAFNRLLEQTGKRQAVHEVSVDDTPMALHAEDIVDSLTRADGSEPFADIFTGRSRAEMIGLFLALLELIRQRRVRASQDDPRGPILLYLLEPPTDDDAEDMDDVSDDAEIVSQSVDDGVPYDPDVGVEDHVGRALPAETADEPDGDALEDTHEELDGEEWALPTEPPEPRASARAEPDNAKRSAIAHDEQDQQTSGEAQETARPISDSTHDEPVDHVGQALPAELADEGDGDALGDPNEELDDAEWALPAEPLRVDRADEPAEMSASGEARPTGPPKTAPGETPDLDSTPPDLDSTPVQPLDTPEHPDDTH